MPPRPVYAQAKENLYFPFSLLDTLNNIDAAQNYLIRLGDKNWVNENGLNTHMLWLIFVSAALGIALIIGCLTVMLVWLTVSRVTRTSPQSTVKAESDQPQKEATDTDQRVKKKDDSIFLMTDTHEMMMYACPAFVNPRGANHCWLNSLL